MKRIVIMTVILFVLSLGGLAMMTLLLCRAQDKVEFTCVAQRGDPAVAEGLHLTEKDLLSSRVVWTTEHDLGARTQETKSRFSAKGLSYTGAVWDNEYGIYVMKPDKDYLQSLAQPDEQSVLFRPAEKMAYYDLAVVPGSSRNDEQVKERYDDLLSIDFPMLRIPVGQEDWMSMGVMRYSDGVDFTNVYASYLENGFHSWSAPAKEGTVMTVGFGPTVQPKADWAPEGFGLWLMAQSWSEPGEERIQLVYPLDIERQRVAYLSSTEDGEYILLFLAEGEKLTLQMLDAETFRPVQTLDMGKIGQKETEVTYYDSDNDEQGQTSKGVEYEPILVRRGEDFCVVAMGKRLTVLAYRERSLKKLFDCDMMDLYLIYIKDGLGFAWEDENVDSERIAAVCNPLKSDWEDDFEHMSMVLKDGKLAIAWNVDNINQVDVMVEVYSAEGLVYAQGIRCGLLHQGAGQTVRAMQRPNIAWSS